MTSFTIETPSPLDAARKLVPMIRSCADEIEAQRELPRPLFEALADAGMFQLALPRSLGGAELDLPTYAQVIEEIGRADASTMVAANVPTKLRGKDVSEDSGRALFIRPV